MNVSDQIAAWLVKKNIEHAFMVTGGGAMFLNQAFGTHKHIKSIFFHKKKSWAPLIWVTLKCQKHPLR